MAVTNRICTRGRARAFLTPSQTDGEYVSRAFVTKNSGISSAVYSKVTGHEVGHNLGCEHQTTGFMKQGNHSERGMPSATRRELDNHTGRYNSCLSERTCVSFRGF